MTDYQQPRCPHGWVDVTQCESCAQAAEIDALRKQVAYLTDLAQGRLEQMDADRKQYLDLRDKVKKMDVEGHPV